MNQESSVRSFFRVAKMYPPSDDDYRTMQDKLGNPPPDAPQDVREAWGLLSAYDSEEGARRQARARRGKLGHLIVRYDIPTGAAITWKQSFGAGHYTLIGDKEELKHYLTDVVVEV